MNEIGRFVGLSRVPRGSGGTLRGRSKKAGAVPRPGLLAGFTTGGAAAPLDQTRIGIST
jgi:hypothetical protein